VTEGSTEASMPSTPGAPRVQGPLIARPLLWIPGTALLLTLGFVAGIYGLTQLAAWMRPDTNLRSTQTALVLYARIVLLKALWPHVLLTTLAYTTLERTTPIGSWPGSRQCAAFIALALIVATFVTAILLPSDALDLATIRIGSTANFIATVVEIAAATTAAATITRWLLNRFTRN